METREEDLPESGRGLSIIQRALLVEDNAACQRVMYCYLSNLGYQVECTGNTTTTIEKLNHKNYDLIVLDLGLPDRYGTEVIKAVRQSKLNLDSILLVWSAHIDKKDYERFLILGADSILPKPCTSDYLEALIQKCFKTPRYERKFHFQLKIIRKKYQRFLAKTIEIGDIEYANELKSIFQEAFFIIEEYLYWLSFHTK